MDLSRRNFLIGVGAGLILPSYYELARKHVANSGEPLIMAPRSPEIKLIAHDYAGNGSYTLNWGDPYSELPLFDDMTWRQFADNYMHGAEGYLDLWKEDGIDLDDTIEEGFAEETWILKNSPNAKAYDLLRAYNLGLGDHASTDDGQIEFIECDSPGSNYRGVEVDVLGLSLLQDKLNQLDTAIEISLYRCSKS